MSHASVLVAVDVVDPADRQAVEEAVEFQMEPFREEASWFEDGSRWDWYQIGGRFSGKLAGADIVQVKALDLDNLKRFTAKRWMDSYKKAESEVAKSDSFPVVMVYGFDPREITLEEHLKSAADMPFTAYAFLRDRHWHEGERLGWFGSTAKTECEIARPYDPDVLSHKCLTKGIDGARIVTWQEPWEIWTAQFYKRFVVPLAPETTVVVVDYHV